MEYRSFSPRTQDRCRTRRRPGFRPSLHVLEDRIVPDGVGWVIDADPNAWTNALDPGDPTNPNRPAAVYVAGNNLPGGTANTIAKYTTDGSLLWSHAFNSSSTNGGVSSWGVAVDPSGNVYLSGYFSGTMTMGSQTLTSAGTPDAFVAKFDPAGNALWARNIGGPGSGSYGLIITADSSGAYLAGHFTNTAYFNNDTSHPILTSAGDADGFVLKLDTTGNLVYATRAGGSGTDYAVGVAVNGTGQAFVTGYFMGTASFGGWGSLTSVGSKDNFIAQLDASGNFTWVRQMGGAISSSGWQWAYGVGLDGNGHVVATGTFYGTPSSPAAFGNSTTDGAGAASLVSLGSQDAFVTSLDAATGHFLWTRQLGGAGSSMIARELALDSSGNIYTVGTFVGNSSAASSPSATAIDFDPGPGTALLTSDAGLQDGYLSKLSPTGSFLGAWKMGSSNNGYNTTGVSVASDGAIYSSGVYSGTATFDTGTQYLSLTASGSRGTFLIKTVQDLGAIFGRALTGQTDNGVPIGQFGRTVTLVNSAGSTVASTTAGQGGAFVFAHLAADTYTVQEAPLTGWTAPAVTVTVGPGVFVSGQDLVSSSPTPSRTYTDSKSKKIPFGSLSTSFPITITNTSTIYDINVNLNVTAPSDAALGFRLVGPDGTTVSLFGFRDTSGANFVNTVFDDQGAPISSGAAPYTGSFQAGYLLSDFNGKTLNGTWTLKAYNNGNQQATLNNWSLIVIGSALGSPQLAAGGVAPGGEAAATALTPAKLAPIAHQAVANWAATGLTATQVALLSQVQYSIQDLSARGALGLTTVDTPGVLLDATADGYWWFIDLTPADNAEFAVAAASQELQARPGSPAFGHMDLLTVVEHELGHVLGLDDLDPSVAAHDLMTSTLGMGTRRVLAGLPAVPAAPTEAPAVAIAPPRSPGVVALPDIRPPSRPGVAAPAPAVLPAVDRVFSEQGLLGLALANDPGGAGWADVPASWPERAQPAPDDSVPAWAIGGLAEAMLESTASDHAASVLHQADQSADVPLDLFADPIRTWEAIVRATV
jgi:hypothetical protein